VVQSDETTEPYDRCAGDQQHLLTLAGCQPGDVEGYCRGEGVRLLTRATT
jgi:hypothetical protein